MSVSFPVIATVVRELHPYPDPWVTARQCAHLPHLLFLDSAQYHPTHGRYAYVTADPVAWHLTRAGDAPFPQELQRALPTNTPDLQGDLPPFQGGWAGVFSYDLGRAFERIPAPRYEEFQVPHCALGLYDWVISFDLQEKRAWLISTGVTVRDNELSCCPDRAEERAAQVIAWLQHSLSHVANSSGETRPRLPRLQQGDLAPHFPLAGFPGVTSTFSAPEYIRAVQQAIDYVHAGDCFQVNLAQRLLAPQHEGSLALYDRLRQCNPAPYAGYFDLGTHQIISASPEQFLSVRQGIVTTRPIKGTRPRQGSPEGDQDQIQDLMTNPKDRAENVMIVDLLRNDLGRVCAYGSVTVPMVCELETYAYVHHLVSEVQGRLREDRTAWDLLQAAFPGGSVTGAPKVRAMEIIAELEPTARGAYCGSLGYIGLNGAMDTNILIRTFTAGEGWLQFPVGGGIVADSDPETEYHETLHKAKGLLKALTR